MRATKKLCLIAMGIALFVVLSLCIQVPVFENYYLCLGYVIMAVYCYSFGPLRGTLVGFLGVILYCLVTNGLRGMPGWSVGNIVIGLFVGVTCKVTSNMKNTLLRHIVIAISIVISTAVAMLGVKSIIECFLYSQPFILRIANNIYAFVADAFVLIFSLPICYKMHQLLINISLKNSNKKTEVCMNSVDYSKQDKNYVKEIIYYEDRDWFTVKTKDDRDEDFVIDSNKAGHRWIELWYDYDAFKSLVSAITQDPMIEIVENDTASRFVKYTRQAYEFSLWYIEYVDYMISSYWDGEPFIKFKFVEKGHPDFEAYVNELLRLSDLLKKANKMFDARSSHDLH